MTKKRWFLLALVPCIVLLLCVLPKQPAQEQENAPLPTESELPGLLFWDSRLYVSWGHKRADLGGLEWVGRVSRSCDPHAPTEEGETNVPRWLRGAVWTGADGTLCVEDTAGEIWIFEPFGA